MFPQIRAWFERRQRSKEIDPSVVPEFLTAYLPFVRKWPFFDPDEGYHIAQEVRRSPEAVAELRRLTEALTAEQYDAFDRWVSTDDSITASCFNAMIHGIAMSELAIKIPALVARDATPLDEYRRMLRTPGDELSFVQRRCLGAMRIAKSEPADIRQAAAELQSAAGDQHLRVRAWAIAALGRMDGRLDEARQLLSELATLASQGRDKYARLDQLDVKEALALVDASDTPRIGHS